ncbi:MAG: IS3 family transposase [Christensenellaceae bacterium]|nr:IS3 family transposase [Christensenellaceae bacterium]
MFEYVNYWNSKRPHSTINYDTPDQFEEKFFSPLGERTPPTK